MSKSEITLLFRKGSLRVGAKQIFNLIIVCLCLFVLSDTSHQYSCPERNAKLYSRFLTAASTSSLQEDKKEALFKVGKV